MKGRKKSEKITYRSNLFDKKMLFTSQVSIWLTINRHVSMKNFFTLFIAVILLSLCLLEKEARKNALLMENINKEDLVGTNQVTSPVQPDNGLVDRSGFDYNNHLVANDRMNIVDSHQSVAADSLSFL